MLPTEPLIQIIAYAYTGSIRRRISEDIVSGQVDTWDCLLPSLLCDVSATFASVIASVSRNFAGIPIDAEISE